LKQIPQETIFKINSILEKYLSKEHQVIFFGSYINGKPHKNSDIDIAIKGSDKLDPSLWAKIEEEFDQSDILQKIDLVDYHRVTPEFQKIISETGVDYKKS